MRRRPAVATIVTRRLQVGQATIVPDLRQHPPTAIGLVSIRCIQCAGRVWCRIRRRHLVAAGLVWEATMRRRRRSGVPSEPLCDNPCASGGTSAALRDPRTNRARDVRSERRRFLGGAIALLIAEFVLDRGVATAAPARTATIAAMQAAREREIGVYYRYIEFGRKAARDGYRGIAYLFTAFAASELIHATNFGKILAQLNVEVAPIAKPAIVDGSTRENLVDAVDDEIDSIDEFYPRLLKQLEPEGFEDAMATVRYAWASEKQHRDKLRQLQRFSGTFFDQVARRIDEKTGQYYVCQMCGSTVNVVPADACPICRKSPTNYRRIEPPA
jgi:rubrerythrin